MGAENKTGKPKVAARASAYQQAQKLREENRRLALEAREFKERLADCENALRTAGAPPPDTSNPQPIMADFIQLVLPNFPDPAMILDRNGLLIACSDKALTAMQVDSLSQVHGLYFWDLCLFLGDKEFAENSEQWFLDLKSRRRRAVVSEQRISFPGLKDRSFHTVQFSPIKNAAGVFEGVMVTCRDTTELRQSTAETSARALLDAMPMSVFLWDEHLNLIDCNQEALHTFGLAGMPDAHTYLHELHPPFQPDGTHSNSNKAELFRQAVEAGYMKFEWMHCTASGEPLPMEKILVRIPWQDGWRIASYNRDLRETKAHEQKMLEVQEHTRSLEVISKAAQMASQAKSEFLAKMSHELRTPLNAVIGFLGLELQKELPAETADNLEISLDACHNLLHLINDILDISKIEAGRFELASDTYRLVALINEIVSLNAFRVDSQHIAFRLEMDENLPSRLRGDALRIKQILNNLLCNAFKYTQKGTVTLAVDLEPQQEKNADKLAVRFSVRDTGQGIEAKNLESLFNSYARFDSRTNRLIEGTGLGLAITKHLVEKMDGHIQVESEYGKGSIFACTIPQAVIDSTPIGRVAMPDLAAHSAVPHRQRNKCGATWHCSHMPFAKVLVVDDVPTNLGVAKGMLQRYGMTVDCAADGQEAVDLIRSGKTRYNAVFMDHMMPGMDGIEALRRIRAIDTNYARSVPIIVLTANVIAGNEKMFLDNGFQAFLGKPIDPLKLDAIINKWVKDARQEVRPNSPRRRREDHLLPPRPSPDPEEAMTSAAATAHKLEGLDAQEAISRFGSVTTFFEVLRSYAATAPQLAEQMRDLASQKSWAELAIIAHGMKGASYGVGANALGDMAKKLEYAASSKNWRAVRKQIFPFLEATEKLLREIGALLHEAMPESASKESKPLRPAPDAKELAALHKASLSCSHSAMEQHLKKLEQYRYQSDAGLITWLRARVDALDYDLINKRLAEFSS